jgi:serine/threonine protein phosphatase 1
VKASGIYAIGDVHGCREELRELLDKLPLDEQSHVIFLGDCIDRGPSSRGVIDLVLELREFCRVTALMGNHELMLHEFLDGSDPRRSARFILNGGGATLASYADDDGVFIIPPEHRELFSTLPYFHVEEDFCFVHAGIPVDVPFLDVATHGEDMVWMRQRRGVREPRFSKIIVHGHTPIAEVEIEPGRINLDTSCVYGNTLTAMELRTRQTWHVERSAVQTPVYLHDARDSRRRALRFKGKVPVTVSHAGLTLQFETINYSEIGLLIAPTDRTQANITPGSTITGLIGTGPSATPFRGVVLRIEDGARVAVKLIPDPPKPT